MHYPTFTVDDFCKDAYFIGWVMAPTDESNRFWRAFLADYPHKASDVQLATDYVRSIRFNEITPSTDALFQLKRRIWTDLDRPIHHVQWYRRPMWAVAATMLLVGSAGLGWWAYRAGSKPTYQTAYGTIQTINLADGSRVTLNANSSLNVADNLADSPVREVWLDGEAYFSVAKHNGAAFIVHTSEANVEVLGTQFNVNTRREQTSVVLHEGKVQLTTTSQPAVVMKPGDMATVSPQNRAIQLRKVQPAVYEAWKEAYIILDGKSLPEIVGILEDNFGVTIRLEDSLLVTKKLTGKLQTDVAGDCIENLATILDADVEKKGDTYLFR